MISYSQNREDALLSRAFGDQPTGFYIDVGANDPTTDSVTRHFYDRGWHGINIEPGAPFDQLCRQRSRDINLNVAVSSECGEATFYELAGTGLSTLCKCEAGARRHEGRQLVERAVKALSLAAICEAHVTGEIDFISIDVEGHERDVIAGGDWRRWRPRVAVVEATRPNTSEPSHESWEPLLVSSGYLLAAFDGLNRFYVREEDRPLLASFSRPLSVLDGVVPYAHFHEVQSLEGRIARLETELAYARRNNPLGYLVGRVIHKTRCWLAGDWRLAAAGRA